MGDERDRAPRATDEPDVEAHRAKLHPDDAAKTDGDDDDAPDVEAHAHKHV